MIRFEEDAQALERRKLAPGDMELKGAHQLACELQVCCGEAAAALERRQLAPGDLVKQGWPSVVVEGTES